jgi:large subunit ribosomal protein L15
MIKTKKRKKQTRMHGTHTHKRGFKKKARGKGHRGGVGNAGTGKKADQKKTKVTKLYGGNYFGKSKTWRKILPVRLEVINLSDLSKKLNARKEIVLENYKILGNGSLTQKVKIKAHSASNSAIAKIKSSGSTLELEEDVSQEE